jgi:hypothetical protein
MLRRIFVKFFNIGFHADPFSGSSAHREEGADGRSRSARMQTRLKLLRHVVTFEQTINTTCIVKLTAAVHQNLTVARLINSPLATEISPEAAEFCPKPTPYFLKIRLITISLYTEFFQEVSSQRVFQPKFCTNFCFVPRKLHAPSYLVELHLIILTTSGGEAGLRSTPTPPPAL